MKLFDEYPELAALREKLDAPLSDWKIGTSLLDPREQILRELERGRQVEADEVEAGPGRLLTYKGEQIILYIKDTQASKYVLEHEPEQSRRFHIAECSTLEKMRRHGRWERYVATNRMEETFLVDWKDPDTNQRGETEAALKVCKNCLSALNYRGYSEPAARLQIPEGVQEKSEIWATFSLSEFLMEFSTFFSNRPERTPESADLDQYVADWARISEQRRRAANWTCEDCGVNLSGMPGSLHCHHISGVKTDNSIMNLSVLCALCHSEQPFHGHMKVPARERNRINEARITQGIEPSFGRKSGAKHRK